MDVVNVDKKSREKEKGKNMNERFYFVTPSAKKGSDLRTTVELAAVILGDKKIATGQLLEKSNQKSTRTHKRLTMTLRSHSAFESYELLRYL